MTEKKSDKKPWIIAATKIKEAASSFSYKQKRVLFLRLLEIWKFSWEEISGKTTVDRLF